MLEVSNLVISNFCALTSAAAWIIAATSCLPTPPCTAALGGPVLHARGQNSAMRFSRAQVVHLQRPETQHSRGQRTKSE